MLTNMDKLYESVAANGPVCVGLDTEISYLPTTDTAKTAGENVVAFNRALINATKGVAGCFKVQIAYYESLGLDGMRAYAETLKLARATGLPDIADIKRGDIATTAEQYDETSDPQIVMTLQGPSDGALVKYLAENRENLVYALEKAERDRAVKANETYGNPGIESAIFKTFGVEMKVPKGYTLAAQKPDFIWARNEYPTASQGFFIYSYPYEGKQSLTEEALVAARNKFAAQIPGPSEGSYMITSDAFAPDYRMFRMEGRLWCELRGFWDVHGDFMGGPFVSYTTVDTATDRVFTLDCYVYAPDLNKPRKRNYIRGLEHLLYSVRFPQQ